MVKPIPHPLSFRGCPLPGRCRWVVPLVLLACQERAQEVGCLSSDECGPGRSCVEGYCLLTARPDVTSAPDGGVFDVGPEASRADAERSVSDGGPVPDAEGHFPDVRPSPAVDASEPWRCSGAALAIGPEGGTVRLETSKGPVSAHFPRGAVGAPVVVCLTVDEEARPVGYTVSSPVVEIGPVDLSLRGAVEVSLPVGNGDPVSSTVFWAGPGDEGRLHGDFERLGATIEGEPAVATVAIDRLGRGFVADGIHFGLPFDASCSALSLFSVQSSTVGRVGLFFDVRDCHGQPATGLTADDIQLWEQGQPIGQETSLQQLSWRGQTVVVTVLIDATVDTLPFRPALLTATQAFVEQLITESPVPVQVGLKRFDGSPGATWLMRPTGDVIALLAALDTLQGLGDGTDPLDSGPNDPGARNLYRAVVDEVIALERWQAGVRDRNDQGVFTRGFLVVVSAGPDTAGYAPVERMRGATVQTPAVEVVAVTLDRGEPPSTPRPGFERLPPSAYLRSAPAGVSLLRELTAAAAYLLRRMGGIYLLTYCARYHVGGVRTELALAAHVIGAGGERPRAEFTVDTNAFSEACSPADPCGDRSCGGFLCGACEDALGVCDAESGGCVDHCEAHDWCQGPAYVTPEGYAVTCPAEGSRRRCGDACVDLARDVAHCGACDRFCNGRCDQGQCRCIDGRARRFACGRNGRGWQERICADGRWGPVQGCADPDICTDGEARPQACGLNGRGTMNVRCEMGDWARIGSCPDPDVCMDHGQRVSATSCGLNDRGRGVERCVAGQWIDSGLCEDPDRCEEGDHRPLSAPCGLNGRGEAKQVCRGGDWAEPIVCVDSDRCEDGDQQMVAEMCGLNGRGGGRETCEGGQWQPVGLCLDADLCEDSQTRISSQPCGPNGTGHQEQRCQGGQWRNNGGCVNGGECRSGQFQAEDCGLNGRDYRVRSCEEGQWQISEPCTDLDACTDTTLRNGPCGLNGRGGIPQRCEQGQWLDEGDCVDPDVCIDGDPGWQLCPDELASWRTGRCEAGHLTDWVDLADCQTAYVELAPGEFTMGSPQEEPGRADDEGPPRAVTLTHRFVMRHTEVTQGHWQAVMGANPATHAACGVTCPVESISWWSALAYVNTLSVAVGLTPCYVLTECTGEMHLGTLACGFVTLGPDDATTPYACEGYRLPTEAEWEYAARAGTATAHYAEPVDRVGWYRDNAGDGPRPVATREANAFGLFDMLGNVSEWVWDRYGVVPDPVDPVDPVGAGEGPRRVIRGGAWIHVADHLRAAARDRDTPDVFYPFVGFRPVRTLH